MSTVCLQYVYSMFKLCLHSVYIMFTVCLQYVYSMFTVCLQYVYSMFTVCHSFFFEIIKYLKLCSFYLHVNIGQYFCISLHNHMYKLKEEEDWADWIGLVTSCKLLVARD